MDNNPAGFLSEMGISDIATSSSELSFTEIKRVIDLILDDCYPEEGETSLPQLQSPSNLFTQEKSNYFIQVSSNIIQTKNNFLQRYTSIRKEIEEMTQEVLQLVNARERELKAQVERIREEKFAKWNRQLSVCEKVLGQLKTCEFSSFGSVDNFCSYFAKELGFVDAGEIKFETGCYFKVLKCFRSLGKVTYHVESNFSGSGLDSLRAVTPKFTFGSNGAGPGQFCRSWGICSDVTGRILVCDRSNHRVQIFNECGEFLIQFGKEGSKPGEFNRPSGIDVDKKCKIVVADKDNHRIQVFTFSGYYLFGFGSEGTKPGQFMYPWDVAVNSNCDIVVSDSKNHRIQFFNEQGNIIAIFGGKEMGVGNVRSALQLLDSPRGLAFRPDNKLLVTDFNNHRVLLIDTCLKHVATFGSEGSKPGKFFRPQGIACDKKTGQFAVADSKNYRVQVFDADGKLVKLFGSQGSKPGQFDCPQGIAFHANQNLLVVDLSNNRVQVF